MEDELEQRAADYLSSVLGFNGERIDPVLGGYQLGNGYRLYSPSLRRFTSPDSMSPFGQGGINPYAYCEGDPINNTDPTGHHGSPLRDLMEFGEDFLEDFMDVETEGVSGEALAAGSAARVPEQSAASNTSERPVELGRGRDRAHRGNRRGEQSISSLADRSRSVVV